ncbi:MAG: hypothetical protein EOM03_18935, partial [Clostridia bacterium]|nr:hypothetical protein [Clostridia bacterium]
MATGTEQSSSSAAYKAVRPRYDNIVSNVKAQEEFSDQRRRFRLAEYDVLELRREKKLADDETFIPERLIDQGIQADVPQYMEPLQSARALVLFKDLLDPARTTLDIAHFFTDLIRQGDWLSQWLIFADSLSEQGGACSEVLF